jgi:small subunit ribosomal protein S15
MKEKTITTTKSTDVANVGSPEAQATALTEKINHLTGHLKTRKKDHMARRGLVQAVGARKRHLKYIASKSPSNYLKLIQKLGLRK